jgi:hypothetical protein
MTRQRIITNLELALARTQLDNEFRAEILEEGREAQFDCSLSDHEWHQLVAAAEQIERRLQADPFEATEVDHGEADAAGVKG